MMHDAQQVTGAAGSRRIFPFPGDATWSEHGKEVFGIIKDL